MNKNKQISPLQYASFIIFPILSIFSGIGFHNIIKISKVDCYISILFSFVFGFIILGLTIYILNYQPDKNIHEKINILFGKTIGTIINLIIALIIFIISLVIMYGICSFIVSQYLSETPVIIIGLMLSVVIIYNITKGIEVVARSNMIFLAIIILLSIISFVGLLPKWDLSNIKPILEYGFSNPIKGGFILTLTNIVPTIAILTIPKNNVINYPKLPKYLLGTYTLSYVLMFLIAFKTISILGIDLTEMYQYPEYIVLKKISILNFFDKIENIIFIKWILTSFSSLTLMIYYLNNSIKKENTKIILPTIITALIVFTATFYFENNTKFTNFIEYIYPYINLFLLIIIIIIALNIFAKKIIKKEKT